MSQNNGGMNTTKTSNKLEQLVGPEYSSCVPAGASLPSLLDALSRKLRRSVITHNNPIQNISQEQMMTIKTINPQ